MFCKTRLKERFGLLLWKEKRAFLQRTPDLGGAAGKNVLFPPEERYNGRFRTCVAKRHRTDDDKA